MTTDTAVSRREILRRIGLAGAAALALPALDRVLAFQREVLKPGVPERGLNPVEAETLTAVCARIIPTDDSGPGAAEARAAEYIDRALGGWLSPSREAYSAGLAAVDTAARVAGNQRFIHLTPPQQDAVLTTLEDTAFFALVRAHTIQGMFSDPVYGGNANFVGWDLIGYPGVRLHVTAADQRMGTTAKPLRRSAYDYAMFAAGAH